MPITPIDVTATVGTTEFSIVRAASYSPSAPQTGHAFVQVVLDVSALAAGDEIELRVYERVSSGTQRVLASWPIIGPQSELFVSPALTLTDGWDWTLKKLAGADRAIRSSVRKVT